MLYHGENLQLPLKAKTFKRKKQIQISWTLQALKPLSCTFLTSLQKGKEIYNKDDKITLVVLLWGI